MDRFRLGRSALELDLGDITLERTDAIANAANGTLLGGGGVDGAIHAAAGPQLLAACREVKKKLPLGKLPAGEAAITPGFLLPARFVIHCVGPVYDGEGRGSAGLLASCYRRALRLCRSHGLSSVAFPSISTGVYGYPVRRAAGVALAAALGELSAEEGPGLVRWVLFDERTYEAYLAAALELGLERA